MKYKILFFVILVIVSVAFAGYYIGNSSTNQENTIFRTILYAQSKASDVSIIDQKAEAFYLEASYFYEDRDYNDVESNCRLARDYYMDSSQKYKEIKSEILSYGIKDNLINIYTGSLEILSEISLNMYEACEHFESASRYYDTYYNTNVPANDMSYDMGTGEIDAMNEKIKLHDENVKKYNSLLSDFEVELKKRIE